VTGVRKPDPRSSFLVERPISGRDEKGADVRKALVAIAVAALSFGVMGFTRADAAVCKNTSTLAPVEGLVDGQAGSQADIVFGVVNTIDGIALAPVGLVDYIC
jgi:hypothetical protein